MINRSLFTKKNVTPLAPKALKEMRYIMDGILDGSLEHNQGVWHEVVRDKQGNACGTAHCFAGWGEYLGKKSEVQKKSLFQVAKSFGVNLIEKYFPKNNHEDPSKLCIRPDDCNSQIYAPQYCNERWGLTKREGDYLYEYNNTKKDLNNYIKMFEKGYRMVD